MNVLFKESKLSPLIHSLQNLLKKVTVHDDYLELEEYTHQLLKFEQDLNVINSAIDTSIIIAITDLRGYIVYVNNKFCEISKYSRSELIGANHRIVNSGYHDKLFFRDMWKTIAKGEVWEGEVKNKAKDGALYWVKTTIIPILDENQKPTMYISLRTDITEGKIAQEKLVTALSNDFRLVVNSMYNLIFKVKKDRDKKFIYTLNEGKLAYKLGLENEKMFTRSPEEIYPNSISTLLEEKYEQAFNGENVTYTYSHNGKSLLTYLAPVYENNKVVEIIGCVNDITELHNAQEEIKYMAFHDILTNLPNRRSFNEDMTKLIAHSKIDNEQFAIFFLDLDRFKQINDSLGHTVGDMLIQEVSNRLKIVVGTKGFIYRFAGDEFILIFPKVAKEEISIYAKQIISIFEQSFVLANSHQIFTTPSIGISVYPAHGDDYDTLLKNADTAMFVAKSRGRNAYQLYEPSMNEHHEESLMIEQYLRQAIVNNEFELFFQPKMDLASNKIKSMETLLRWNNPIIGNVPPDKFIPIAEETGLIIKIDEWVLENACRQNMEWNKEPFSSQLRIAVNISPLHFRLPNFVEKVENTLRKTGLSPNLLEIEITESSFIDNMDECIKSLNKLREMGVQVAIDDFGIGYSSLNYLRRFPISSLKIDRSFIQEISQNNEEIAIVKAMIYLSHELNLKVVAEGTETKEVIDLLKELGCNEVQGYYISRPVPKIEFEQLIKQINGEVSKESLV